MVDFSDKGKKPDYQKPSMSYSKYFSMANQMRNLANGDQRFIERTSPNNTFDNPHTLLVHYPEGTAFLEGKIHNDLSSVLDVKLTLMPNSEADRLQLLSFFSKYFEKSS